MTIKVECNIEKTKSDKWRRLTPTGDAPIGPIVIKASEAGGKQKATVTVTL